MKKLTLLALLISILFVSCSKDQPETEETQNNYYVRFKKNGTIVNYTGIVIAHRDTINGYVELKINGAHSIAAVPYEYMGIYINNFPGNANIGTGLYVDNSTSYTLLTTHIFGGISYEAGESLAQSAAQHNMPLAKPFKVTITQINGSTVKGSFEGDYYEDADVTTGNMVQVTEGSFYAKFQ